MGFSSHSGCTVTSLRLNSTGLGVSFSEAYLGDDILLTPSISVQKSIVRQGFAFPIKFHHTYMHILNFQSSQYILDGLKCRHVSSVPPSFRWSTRNLLFVRFVEQVGQDDRLNGNWWFRHTGYLHKKDSQDMLLLQDTNCSCWTQQWVFFLNRWHLRTPKLYSVCHILH